MTQSKSTTVFTQSFKRKQKRENLSQIAPMVELFELLKPAGEAGLKRVPPAGTAVPETDCTFASKTKKSATLQRRFF